MMSAEALQVVGRKVKAIRRKPAEPVYDIQVKKNHNFFANKSLVHNCIIFQEQVMELAEKVAGFPKDKCDEVRRAIMKRSISGGDAARKAAQETRDGFVKGCVANGYTEQVANNLYDKILYFAGYGFNKAHAVAYAIDSYWCAWLMTYYEEQWICSYLESMSNTPDQRAKAFGEVKALGYKIVPIDVNHAAVGWTVLPGKKLMPSMTSVKGVGASAVEEIMQMRPFNSIEEMLWEDGSWRLSKFNKKAFEALVKVQAFDSLGCVGPDKVFKSYRHMHDVLFGQHTEVVHKKKKGVEGDYEIVMDHGSMIKRCPKGDPNEGRKNFYELARASKATDEWSRKELGEFQVECFGTMDVAKMFDPKVMKHLEDKGVKSIDEWDQKGIYWFVISEQNIRKTKNGKAYLDLKVVGSVGKEIRMKAWGYKEDRQLSQYTLCFAEVDRNDFGYATTMWRLKDVQ